MSTTDNPLEDMVVVRLNADMFPISQFEREAYQRYGIHPRRVDKLDAAAIEDIAACDGLCVVSESLPAELIDRLTRCRVISRLGAGTDKIDCRCATRHGILVTNVPDFCAEEQADHVMALLLAVARKLPEMRTKMLAGHWGDSRAACRSLHRLSGRVLGLVGWGWSAKAVARRANGFGLRVIACRQSQSGQDADARQLGVEMTDLATLLSSSDYVSLHLPLTDQTRQMFTAERFASMRAGAIFINTARGGLVDEVALAASLGAGHLAGAGLDTFQDINVHVSTAERPPEHPLLELDNVVFTPHVAGFSEESARDVGYGAIENLAAVLSGRWPTRSHIVNHGVQPRFPLD